MTENQAPALSDVARRRIAEMGELKRQAEDPFLTRREVQADCAVSRATLFRRIARGTFPPAEQCDGLHRWRRSHVEAWKRLGADWRDAIADKPPN